MNNKYSNLKRMDLSIITSQNLDTHRKVGDQEADSLIKELVESKNPQYYQYLLKYFTDYSDLDPNHEEDLISNFFKNNSILPEFLSKKDIIRATEFYTNHQQNIGIILGCYSLPYCYLGADGAKVLVKSQRIKNDTYRRLKETGYFLRKVMNLDFWENGKVFVLINKIRLFHALIRYFTLNHGKWDNDYGYPINQEDMAGTNLAFSWIVLRGLRKLGYKIDDTSERAYLNIWAGIGKCMGLDEQLLCFTPKDCVNLDKLISKRQFKKSEEGVELTKSLLDCYSEMAGSQLAGEFFMAQSRLLLGETYADWLEIPKTKFPQSILNAYNKSNSFLSILYA